jgi:hypothetical protein
MAAKLNRLILQLRATRTKMMLADASNPKDRPSKEQAPAIARSTERGAEALRRVPRRRSHG